MYYSDPRKWPMDDEKTITNEFVAGQNSVIITMLNHIQADNKANHRENSQKIDVIAGNTSSIRSDVDRHHTRITSLERYNRDEVEPLVTARKKRKWLWIGGTGVFGVVSSPGWLPKLVAIFQAAFP